MNNRRYLLVAAIAVALVQIGFLVTMITGRAAILRDGTEILLKTEPVDPRDLLRGDYVVLSYGISVLPAELIQSAYDGDEEQGDRTIYVRLAPDADGFHQPVAARLDHPPEAEKGPEEVDVRGMVRSWAAGRQHGFFVDYGIERYYVPEGEGLAIEEGMMERDFVMRVAVSASGTAQIRSFHDDGRLLYEEPWY